MDDDLTILGRTVRRTHKEGEAAFSSQIEHAANAGRAITEAKRRVPPEQWGAWVDEHLDVDRHGADVYMRIAEPENLRKLTELGMDGAVRELVKRPELASDPSGLFEAMLDRGES